MDATDRLTEQFEARRLHLRAVAYRMLRSVAEADDAVQEAWLRASRADTSDVENIGGWLTTVVVRVCLNMLRSREARREEPMDPRVPDSIVIQDHESEEYDAIMDSLGAAIHVVLATLTPAGQLAFVLHDVFSVPFDEIASIVGRSPMAVRQLASRARRQVVGTANRRRRPDVSSEPGAVDAFLAAARGGQFDALLDVLLTSCPQRSSAPCIQARRRWIAVRAADAARLSFRIEAPARNTRANLNKPDAKQQSLGVDSISLTSRT